MGETLQWGCTRALPEGTTTAWGARLIWPGDLLWDRQGTISENEETRKALHDWLNSGPLRSALERMWTGDRAGLSPEQQRTVTLYEDALGCIKGDPQGSYGYLYIVGYFWSAAEAAGASTPEAADAA